MSWHAIQINEMISSEEIRLELVKNAAAEGVSNDPVKNIILIVHFWLSNIKWEIY